jgi:hypothetical protein
MNYERSAICFQRLFSFEIFAGCLSDGVGCESLHEGSGGDRDIVGKNRLKVKNGLTFVILYPLPSACFSQNIINGQILRDQTRYNYLFDRPGIGNQLKIGNKLKPHKHQTAMRTSIGSTSDT